MKFLKGADISSLQAMEDEGAVFYDWDGARMDGLLLLKSHGVNYIRLRVWNDPTTSFDGGDYCDLKHTIQMARRVKTEGLGLLLDFHYCDSWADWKSQTIPAKWQEKSREQLGIAVYEYTKEVLEALKNAGCYPDMVQIGNEIGNGLLWDYGRLECPENIVYFLNMGLKAVEDTAFGEQKAETMIHLECGGDMEKTEQFFQSLFQKQLMDFDVVGLSYYPYWSGSYDKLQANMKNIGEKFHKKVLIVETAFPYTDDSNDDMPNVVTSELTMEIMGLKASPENQKAVLEQIFQVVSEQENGYGVFYWEPLWYCVNGVGAEKGKGNEWENQTLVNQSGNALESLQVFAASYC